MHKICPLMFKFFDLENLFSCICLMVFYFVMNNRNPNAVCFIFISVCIKQVFPVRAEPGNER